MSCLKIIFLLSLVACSSVKKYERLGEPNMNINLKSSAGFLNSDGVNIKILESIGNCQYAVLGTVSVSSQNSKHISLPTNKKLAYIVFYEHSGMFSPETTQQENIFYFQTRPNENYELSISRADGLKEDHFFRIKNAKKNEEDSLKEICSIN